MSIIVRKLSILLCVFLSFYSSAQAKIPVYFCDSMVIHSQDGNDEKREWTISPQVNPDVYSSEKKGEYVTFYTDREELKFLIHPDSVYNFVILLNGIDSAFTQVVYEKPKLEILKDAAEYNFKDESISPNFYYQPSSDKNLQKLRKTYKLDSIAGTGDELSQMLNLMHWLHNKVAHDGEHSNPSSMNAMDMIKACKKGDRGLNCRGLAITLNECYLAMGMKSRHITCMPKDSIFDDCHVINIVYSNQLQKWIWLDPTWNAYIMDENGTLLGPAEVRERLIADQPLFIYENANWNNQEACEKEYYLDYYMAKNLYRIQAPLRSEYNYETRKRSQKTVEYIELLPLDAYQQEPKTETINRRKSTMFNYKTNNPSVFWSKPN